MKIATISDIHFGVMDDRKLYDELTFFVNTCSEEKIDLIVICGDLLDKKISMNSDAAIYVHKFINDLVKLNSTIFLIHGTLSHDYMQIDTFSHYISDKFFIFKKWTKIQWNTHKFLILPEEYVENEHYYDEIYNDNYDYVFGHGMFKHTSFGVNKSTSLIRNNVYFNADDFDNIVKYYVVFGHIHIKQKYKKIIYTGSYSRFSFGETEEKGFYIFEDKKMLFYENKDAPIFLDIKSEKLPEQVDELITMLSGLSEHNDYIRIIIDTQINQDKYNNIIGFVKNSTNTTVKKKIVNNIKNSIDYENEKQKEIEEKLKPFEGLNFYDITIKLMKENYNKDINIERINTLLNE